MGEKRKKRGRKKAEKEGKVGKRWKGKRKEGKREGRERERDRKKRKEKEKEGKEKFNLKNTGIFCEFGDIHVYVNWILFNVYVKVCTKLREISSKNEKFSASAGGTPCTRKSAQFSTSKIY